MKFKSALVLMLLSPFLHAQEKDWLSGRYEFVLSQDMLDQNKAGGGGYATAPSSFYH